MLTRLQVRNFKRFDDIDIELGPCVLLIGPNNGGKTSILHALALWDLARQKWLVGRGDKATNQDKMKQNGVTINRLDVVDAPAMAKFLWKDLQVRSDGNQKKPIQIIVEGRDSQNESAPMWQCGFEFIHANPESFRCCPVKLENGEKRMFVPDVVRDIGVAFLPPMSGLSATEHFYQEGTISTFLGQGKTAEVLRNLCYLAKVNHPVGWARVKDSIQEHFGVELQEPIYDQANGTLTLAYKDKDNNKLDIRCAGYGLLQTLLLMVHMQTHRGEILLLDEPDAHLEIIRQRKIYSTLNDHAQNSHGQLVIASHSEVLLNEAGERDMVWLCVNKPQRVDDRRSQAGKALKNIDFEEYVQAEQTKKILYLEGSTDSAMLQGFAEKLEHPLAQFFEAPNVQYIGNQYGKAKDNFHGLRAAVEDLQGFVLTDNLDSPPREDPYLPHKMWPRNEFENYLMFPAILLRYAESLANGGDAQLATHYKQAMQNCIDKHTLPIAKDDYDHRFWIKTKASDEFLDPVFKDFFKQVGLPPNEMKKTNYHRLIEFVEVDDIHSDVRDMLDSCAIALGYMESQAEAS